MLVTRSDRMPPAASPARPARRHPWPHRLLALGLLLAAPGLARADATTTSAAYSGWLHVIHGDDLGPGPGIGRPTTRHVLVDDRGRWHRLVIAEALLARLGLAPGLARWRVAITGRRAGSPGAHPQAGPAPLIEPQPVIEVDAIDALRAEPAGPRAAAARLVAGAQPWATILCRFADSTAPPPRARSYFEQLMGAARPGLDHYWRDASFGAIDLAGSVVAGWYDLPHPRAHYVPTGPDGIAHLDFQKSVEDCTAAAEADVAFAGLAGVNLMFDDVLDCCAWGGGTTLTRDGQSRAYHVTWLPPWAYANQYVVAHEMGHGFGLPHSSGPYADTYDSDWDVMSGGGTCTAVDPQFGCIGVHPIAHHKDLLGWVSPAAKFTPTPGRIERVALDRVGEPSAGHHMAEIPIPGAPGQFYTVEARRRAGYDAQVPADAVVMHRVDPARGDRAAQVVDPDGNGNPNDKGARWRPGETFADTANRISMTVDEATASGFHVTIVTGGFGLFVTRAGTGTGAVRSGGDIDCGTRCAGVWDAGATVTLTASPDAASAFTGWTGCDAASGTTCTVAMSRTRSVTAAFARAWRLSVAVSGGGRVQSAPGGIDCGAACSATYPEATTVVLSASASPQTVFARWTGNLDCVDGTVSLAGDTTCTAVFVPAPDLVVTAVSDPPRARRPGSWLAVTDTVRNAGLGAAGAFTMRYYASAAAAPGAADKLLIGTRIVRKLAAGASSTATASVWIPLDTRAGVYFVIACADGNGAVFEADEAHNCRAASAPFEVVRPRAPSRQSRP